MRLFYTGEHPALAASRRLFRRVPSSPRCNVCFAPFGSIGGALLRRRGYGRWAKNPNICRRCIVEMGTVGVRGAEVEMSMLFADVRGSTELASGMSAAEFSARMNRFFAAATTALLDASALVDKFVGDEVVGLFVPVVAGRDHAGRAVEAAQALLRGVGFDDDPWVPVGVGVHTGPAFLGLVGEGEVADFTAMGDNVNLTSRLASAAGAGEILVSRAASEAAGVAGSGVARTLTLKGIAAPTDVEVLRVGSGR
jgi:adenylate cyclase